MRRQLEDKHVAIIKEMLIKGYRSVSILDIMKQKYGISVSRANIQNIKRLEAYVDVRSDLNNEIRTTYPSKTRNDIKLISDLKWALAEGYSFEEILKNYKVTRSFLYRIKVGQNPFNTISPQYNSQIKKLCNSKKRVNINNKMVIEIKKEFIEKNGEILLKEIAQRHKINSGAVSNTLNLKIYKKVGAHLNSQINSIKKDKKAQKESKKRIKLEIDKEKQNIQTLRERKKQIDNQIKASNAKIKKLRAVA